MTWLYWRKTRHSEKNGTIVCRRLFGRWEVFVGDIHMSSHYLRSVWREVYASLPREFAPQRILMLGLAAGDNVSLLAERFPKASVTAVEWDPEMVRIADELRLFPTKHRPAVITGDAREVIKTLPAKQFDLVIVDIFNSKGVSPSAYAKGFFADIANLLSADGYVAVNAYQEALLLDTASADLTEFRRWKKDYNRVGIYRQKALV